MFIGGLFCKKMSRAAAVSGMLAGFLVMIFGVFFLHVSESGPLLSCNAIFEKKCLLGPPLVYGLPISILVTVVVNVFTKGASAEHVAKCFGHGSTRPGSVPFFALEKGV